MSLVLQIRLWNNKYNKKFTLIMRQMKGFAYLKILSSPFNLLITVAFTLSLVGFFVQVMVFITAGSNHNSQLMESGR